MILSNTRRNSVDVPDLESYESLWAYVDHVYFDNPELATFTQLCWRVKRKASPRNSFSSAINYLLEKRPAFSILCLSRNLHLLWSDVKMDTNWVCYPDYLLPRENRPVHFSGIAKRCCCDWINWDKKRCLETREWPGHCRRILGRTVLPNQQKLQRGPTKQITWPKTARSLITWDPLWKTLWLQQFKTV